MNIVIVGMGEVGRYISRVLVQEGHEVVIIDNSPEALTYAEETLDAMVLKGHGANLNTLREARAGEADLFIAVTDHCEVNILSALRARELGASRTIARVSNLAYLDNERGMVNGLMGIDLVINPNALVALEMHKIVRSSNAVAVEDFADNRIEMIQLPVDDSSVFAGKLLKDIRLPENTLIAGIIRDHDSIVVPGGMDAIRSGDELLIVGRIEQIPKVERMLKRERRRFTRRVIIVGGSQVAEMLARALISDGIEVILIERDRAKAQALSEALQGAIVLNADGTDIHLLEEERVMETDAFIAAAAEDEQNLVGSLLARNLGAPRTIALLHKPDYNSISERLGIDAPLSPRIEVAKQVLKYARAGEVVGITPILEDKGEFLEFIVAEGAPIVGKPLKQVGFPSHANICAVVDSEGAVVPRGDDVIEASDRVVVFTLPEHREEVERFFRRKKGGLLSR